MTIHSSSVYLDLERAYDMDSVEDAEGVRGTSFTSAGYSIPVVPKLELCILGSVKLV